MILEVYDIECLVNLFTYTGYCPKEDKYYQFVISDWRNDTLALVNHLRRDTLLQVGFNNESFDYPVIHHLLNHSTEYLAKSGLDVAQALYFKAQEIINQEFSVIADRNKYIQQLDLYRIFHYNNKARMTSLKDLEIAMRLDNVEEMPIHHTTWCIQGDEEKVLSYNLNDVYATYQFLLIALGKTDNPLYKGEDRIKLRQELQRKFGLPCLNYPDVKIGEQLIIQIYCDKTGINYYDLKRRGGTYRESINLKDCIPSWANFETDIMQSVKNKFESTTITSIKNAFNQHIVFHGIEVDYGTGGVHACCQPGVYRSDDEFMILDQDVGSLYPSLAIQLGIYPEHLGKVFLETYDEDIVSVRLAEKKKPKALRDNVIMKGFKLSANGIYGKSGEESSILYDPLYTMKTTIAGQMFLSLWAEKLVKAIPKLKFLQWNTDGLSYLLPRADLSKAQEVSEEMTRLTGLYIEDSFYDAMIMRDVNNYISIYSDSTPEHEHLKLKGCFEIDKELHKDPSMRIVPIALKEYFVNGVPIKDTILNHKDIYDFCLRLKTNSKSTPYFKYYKDGELISEKLNRTTRYYISKCGGILIKDFGEGRETGINVGYNATIFNRYVEKPFEEYGIDYQFYINEAKKIKEAVEVPSMQLSLFDDFL